MRPDLFKELLRKYRSGETHADQTRLVDEWYESFGEEFPETTHIQKKLIRNELYAQLKSRLFNEKVRKISRTPQNLLLKIAVAALFIIALGIGIWLPDSPKSPSSPMVHTRRVEINAEQGKLKKVQLPDSTIVWLNAGSKLSLSSPFGMSGSREVTLHEGEAFFEVSPDPERPFLVLSDALNVRVMGTSFNVKSYSILDNVQISVVTGVVEVYKQDSLILGTLRIGDELTYHKSTGQSNIRQVATEENKGWLAGKTHLRQASFDELAVAMNQSFGTKLQAGNKTISSQRYTIQLSRELPVEDLIEVICKVHGNQYRKEGNVITVF